MQETPPLIFQPDDPEVLLSFLTEALESNVLKKWEMVQIWDECQQSETSRVELSEKLREAAQKLQLWTLEASPTRH